MADEFGIIKARKSEFSPIDLLRVPHKQGVLVVAYPAFGPAYFNTNVAEMQKHYSHPVTGAKISLREPTTPESISAASYKFNEMAKPQIFDPRWLQAGRTVGTSEGVFVNPPRDKEENLITDEKILKSFLNGAKPVRVGEGVIYIVSNAENLRNFGYAGYDSFKRGEQDSREFAESGLARVLEHTEQPAKNLGEMSSIENYPLGVNVLGFGSVKEPVLRVVVLFSNWGDSDSGRFGVLGGGWFFGGDDDGGGCAFGVLD